MKKKFYVILFVISSLLLLPLLIDLYLHHEYGKSLVIVILYLSAIAGLRAVLRR